MTRNGRRQAQARHEWNSLTNYPSYKADPVRFKAVLSLLMEHDPIRICMQDSPGRETEYSSEANALLEKLHEANDAEGVEKLIVEVFTRYFSARMAERMVNRERLVKEVWGVWNEST